MEMILRIDSIEKYYGNRSSLTKAIDNISFEVDKGEFVAIMGASGSGKTTLLNCISTIDRVTSGRIYVGGQDITELKGNKLNRFRREQLALSFRTSICWIHLLHLKILRWRFQYRESMQRRYKRGYHSLRVSLVLAMCLTNTHIRCQGDRSRELQV